LRIVASADIDGTGRREGEPVVYRWPWHWHLPRLGPWLLLALGVALPPKNRDRRAWFIFLPALVLTLSWLPAARRLGMHPTSIEDYGFVFESLVFGMALFWLNIDKLARLHAGLWFVAGLGMLLLAGIAVGLSYGDPFSGDVAPLQLVTLLPGILLFTILAATRRLARRRSDPVRFTIWLAACGTLFSAVGIAGFDIILALLGSIGADSREILVMILILGLCLCPINLAYMVLMSASAFFRPRYLVWLSAGPLPCPRREAVGVSGS